jgi:hypothetical protein
MIDIKTLISTAETQSPEFLISKLVRDILILTTRISKLDKNSYYYNTIKMQEEDRLIELKNQYFKMKNEYNELSLKKLLKQKNEVKSKLEKVKKLNSGSIRKVSMSIIDRELSIVEDYIKLKSKFEKLKNIKEYSNSELYMFFEV